MIIPCRWKENKKIQELIKDRNIKYNILDTTDFLDATFYYSPSRLRSFMKRQRQIIKNQRDYIENLEKKLNEKK